MENNFISFINECYENQLEIAAHIVYVKDNVNDLFMYSSTFVIEDVSYTTIRNKIHVLLTGTNNEIFNINLSTIEYSEDENSYVVYSDNKEMKIIFVDLRRDEYEF